MIGLGILGLQAYQNQQQTLQLLQQQTNARTALTCLVVKETTVELEAIRSLADHFGTSIPIVPGETRVPIQCKPTGGDDVVIGTSYADDLRGTIRADFMSGEGGNDTIRPQGGSDVVFGGEGSDRLYSLARDHQADRLYGGTGSDVCFVRGSDVTSSCRRVVYP
jgi:Ca2+-binding RTX toxin-like protein